MIAFEDLSFIRLRRDRPYDNRIGYCIDCVQQLRKIQITNEVAIWGVRCVFRKKANDIHLELFQNSYIKTYKLTSVQQNVTYTC